mmetsp:Transcript_5418/g.18310  ORF Transcript_5418/g.18310 Transcript_5418/m.18310 type:complete len:216 (-) Transcript_5418:88-735(-)
MIGGMVPAACASRSRCTSCSLPPAGLSPRPRLMMRRSLSMMLLKSSGQDMCLVGGASSAGAAGGAASPARIPALLVPKMSCPVFSARFRSEIPRWAKASLPMFSSPPPKPVPCIAFCLATIDSERCLGTLSSTMSPRRLIESVPPTACGATRASGKARPGPGSEVKGPELKRSGCGPGWQGRGGAQGPVGSRGHTLEATGATMALPSLLWKRSKD